jgi:tRNA dimethylallyltransferase
MNQIKVVTVVGPTASGKTKLAVELCKLLNGEVISADSMQIYQGMNIATAKPDVNEMDGIQHHLMDFLPADQTFSVSDYVTLAHRAIEEVANRGKLPVICGGTGLYVDSLIQNIHFSEEKGDPVLRNRLYEQAKQDGGQELYQYLQKIDPVSAAQIHPNNIVRVVRAVEVYELTGETLTVQKEKSKLTPSPYLACQIGLDYRDRQKLYERINLRVDRMMEAGLLEEADAVRSMNCSQTARNAIGYKELEPYFAHTQTLDECVDRIKQESRRYAKRQLTWFRRNSQIHWFYVDEMENFEDILKKSQKYIETFFKM